MVQIINPEIIWGLIKMPIDEEKLEELKMQSIVDNSMLEEIMEMEMTVDNQFEFFDTLRESQLFMPVIYSENMFEDIENAKVGDVFEPKGQVGFDINYLTAADGKLAVPLFTSSEMMEKGGLQSSAIVIFMSDLAGTLKQTDRYSLVAVNPMTEHGVTLPMEVFLELFEEPSEEEREFLESLSEMLNLLEEHSTELENDMAFIVRSDENFMVENAVDGVFTPNIPFNISSNPELDMDKKYTNILLMDKSRKVLRIGMPTQENPFDTVIAPGTKFHFQKELDEFTTVWKCGAQPFYGE